ncbi:MAG: hypothetical protein HQL65_16710 [Magnetococcales bacterium]|nr:hypothetical protein [Magnetococcales bacterium]
MHPRKKEKKRWRGIVSHTVHQEPNGVPTRVVMELGDGIVTELDLLQNELRQLAGAELPAIKRQWCMQIGTYLARMALLEAEEKRFAATPTQDATKGQPVTFMRPPPPGVVWWG